jgi:outer membrane protein TolC
LSRKKAAPLATDQIAPDSAAEELPSLFPAIEVTPIDLASALEMVNVRNPQFLLAQQRVVEAAALRQLAAAQILPTINLGTSYDGHTGPLQQSNGNILNVKRNSLYIGAGSVAIAAGTVNIPGLVWNNNPSNVLFGYLQSQQQITVRQYASAAERNAMGLRVATSYLDLLGAEGQRAILLQIRADAAELARLTRNYAKTGQGRDADANRASAEFLDRSSQAVVAEGATLRFSAQLAKLLNLDPAMRLHPTDNWVVPHMLVSETMPLNELLAVAVTQRPELAERQAVIRAAFLSLQSARALPFSPNVFLGLSGGEEGGGSNLVANPVGTNAFAYGAPRFGSFYSRTDQDAMAYWTLRNIGLGNKAMVDAAASRMRNSDWQRLAVFEQVRLEVANAHVQANVRLAQLITSQQAVYSARDSWVEDITRIRGNEGLPIEAVNSLRLLLRARLEYLESIVGYNRAQFALYVALGQPPADALARVEPGTPTQPRLPPQPEQLPPPPIEEVESGKR